MATTVLANGANEPEESPLGAAVHRFNEESSLHHIGMHQLPLTEEEVIAAIRGWDPRKKTSDDIRAVYRAIAETRILPPGAKIYYRDTYACATYMFSVWCIDLYVTIDQKRGHAFRIRDQKISSRKFTTAEIARWKGGPSFRDPE